jgi:carbonic anhydrase
VCLSTVVEDAWAKGQKVVVHGWVYGLHNGLLQDLSFTVNGTDDVAAAYQRALFALRLRHLPAA